MSSIYSWAIDPGENATADSDINWQENQLPSTVNNSSRAMMGRQAEWLADQSGISATGTNALTINANSQFNELQNGLRLTFRAPNTNTGNVTANVNGLGSSPIRKRMGGPFGDGINDRALVSGDLIAGTLYDLIYDVGASGGSGAWIVDNPTEGFAPGTRILFQQTSAPTGWTKITDHNNKALRVVSGSAGSGGTVAFTTAFASQSVSGSVGGTAITAAQMPSHSHNNGTLTAASAGAHTHTGSASSAGAHTHSVSGSTSSAGNHTHGVPTFYAISTSGGNAGRYAFEGSVDPATYQTGGGGAHSHTFSGTAASAGAHTHSVTVNSAGAHTHNVTGTTSSAGSGNTHTHSFSGSAIDLAVQYVDVIIAEKA